MNQVNSKVGTLDETVSKLSPGHADKMSIAASNHNVVIPVASGISTERGRGEEFSKVDKTTVRQNSSGSGSSRDPSPPLQPSRRTTQNVAL